MHVGYAEVGPVRGKSLTKNLKYLKHLQHLNIGTLIYRQHICRKR